MWSLFRKVLARTRKKSQSLNKEESLPQTTVSKGGIMGAIIGDIAGSFYEFCNVKHTDFQMFIGGSNFTDDTVITIAIADWLLSGVSPVKTMRD